MAAPSGTWAGQNLDIGSNKYARLVVLVDSAGNEIGTGTITSMPADPFGANADASVAAGAAGSISAKLRRATQGLEDLKTLIVLAAGTNAIGKLAANSGVDIGDVDVTSNVLPAGGTMTSGTTSITTTASIQVHAGTACKAVVVQNNPASANDMQVGTTGAESIRLTPGQAITLPVSNVNQVYAKNVTSSTQSLYWISVT